MNDLEAPAETIYHFELSWPTAMDINSCQAMSLSDGIHGKHVAASVVSGQCSGLMAGLPEIFSINIL